MRVVITGGCGFVGQMLAKRLVQRGKLLVHGACGQEVEAKIRSIVLADIERPSSLLCEDDLFGKIAASAGISTSVALGSVADAAYCRSLFAGGGAEPVSVFHLGAVMSGQGEADFELVMSVNLHGAINVLEAARHCGAVRPRFIMASAGATLGAGAPTDFVSKEDTVGDWTRATPHTSYGMTKACSELLLSDYSRRKFVDGRGLRLPTVVVRAGAPNAATTGCFSGVVRETLAGIDTVAPVARGVAHAVTGARTAVDCLIALHDAPSEKCDDVLGFDRTVFAPSVALSLGCLEDATLRAVAVDSQKLLGAVRYEVDAKLSAAVASFPTRVACERALQLGLPPADTADDFVRQYVADFPEALAPGLVLAAEEVVPNAEAVQATAVALVTGGGSGIGRAVAVRLAKGGGWGEGSDGQTPRVVVVVTGRRGAKLEETCRQIAQLAPRVETLAWPADLTRPADVARLFATVTRRYGRLDLLFNNAGVNVPPTSVEDLSLADWRSVVGTNLDAAFHVAREAFIVMKAQGGGRIINNGSVSATSPRPGSVAYTASKHAITGLTKSIALDGRAANVACGQIDYGNVVSDISAKMEQGMPQADGSMQPEPRIDATHAADAVHYMASLPLEANVLSMTVMATRMPFVGRG